MKLPSIPHSVKVPALIIIISFTPFLRSCGDVSYGLPFVSIEAASPYALKSLRPLLMLANIAVVTACVLLIRHCLKNRKAFLRNGAQGVVLYLCITWFAYLVVYPLSVHIKILEYLAGLCLYFLYPFYAFAYDIHVMIPASIEKSYFFGDADDIPLRLISIVMIGIWFLLGNLRVWFKSRKK